MPRCQGIFVLVIEGVETVVYQTKSKRVMAIQGLVLLSFLAVLNRLGRISLLDGKHSGSCDLGAFSALIVCFLRGRHGCGA